MLSHSLKINRNQLFLWWGVAQGSPSRIKHCGQDKSRSRTPQQHLNRAVLIPHPAPCGLAYWICTNRSTRIQHVYIIQMLICHPGSQPECGSTSSRISFVSIIKQVRSLRPRKPGHEALWHFTI